MCLCYNATAVHPQTPQTFKKLFLETALHQHHNATTVSQKPFGKFLKYSPPPPPVLFLVSANLRLPSTRDDAQASVRSAPWQVSPTIAAARRGPVRKSSSHRREPEEDASRAGPPRWILGAGSVGGGCRPCGIRLKRSCPPSGSVAAWGGGTMHLCTTTGYVLRCILEIISFPCVGDIHETSGRGGEGG